MSNLTGNSGQYYPDLNTVNNYNSMNPNVNHNQMGSTSSGSSYSSVNPSGNSIPLQSNVPIIGVTTGSSGQFVPGTFKGLPGCTKCNGTGFKVSKKQDGQKKVCKKCSEAQGFCSKCNNTGKKIKDGQPCKCKKDKSDKTNKKDKDKNKNKDKEKKNK